MNSRPRPVDNPEAPPPPQTDDENRRITRDTSVPDAFGMLAGAAAGEALRRVRKLSSCSEPETLHKLRVALRRLRTLWWAFQPLLDKRDAKFHRDEFKSLAEAAGKTRDWDVLRALLSADQPMKDSFKTLIERIDQHRSDALSFSTRTIANAGVERIVQHAMAAARTQIASHTVLPPLDEFATQRAERADKMLKKRISCVVSHRDGDYAALHEVRIAGKRLRYSLEFFAPVLDDHYLAEIERLAHAQEHLGHLNDLVTSETLLREYAFQLGEPHALKKAVHYLQEQQQVQGRVALDMLRADCRLEP
jgi:CHAD domain-containing protein